MRETFFCFTAAVKHFFVSRALRVPLPLYHKGVGVVNYFFALFQKKIKNFL